MEEILVAIQEAANTIATPNWADIMSACCSLLAVFVACFVAKRQNEISRKQTEILGLQTSIADKQNRIALFEKRLEIYDILSSCKASVQMLKSIKGNVDILEFLFVRLVNSSEEYLKFKDKATIYIINCSAKLRCANFFFPEEIAADIVNVAVKLLALANADAKVEEPENYNEIKQSFFESVENLDKHGVIRNIEVETKMI